MKKLLISAMIVSPAVAFAQGPSSVVMSKAPQDADGTGYICLFEGAQNQVQDTFQLVSDNHAVVSNPTVIVFDPKHYTYAAYRNGKLVRTGRASGGATFCKDVGRPCKTPTGKFRVHSLGSADCKSGKYPKPNGGAPMPYCMHFTAAGHALHGSPHVPLDNASHGCIRVSPKDAKWLRHNFVKVGTEVVVRPYSS